MTRRSHVGGMRLLVRSVAADVSISVLVAVLTLVLACAAGLVPRALDTLRADEVRYAADSLSAPQRDVTSATSLPTGAALPEFSELGDTLASTRRQAAPALRALLGDPHTVMRSEFVPADPPARLTDPPGQLQVEFAADPDYRDHIKLRSGKLPKAWTVPSEAADAQSYVLDLSKDAPVDFVLSEATARTMHLQVGDVLTVSNDGLTLRVRVSGLFDPVDASGDYWANTPTVTVANHYDNGDDINRYTGTGFVDPATVRALEAVHLGIGITMWFPVAAAAVTPQRAEGIVDGIRALAAAQIKLPDSVGYQLRSPVSSELDDALTASLARIGTAESLLALLASGPLGVVIAVFALGVRAVVDRRSAAYTLAAARGASGRQLRAAAALEGLATGLPAAVLGAVAAALLLPAGGGAAAWLAPLAAGLVPAALFALLGAHRGFRTTRGDLSALGRGRGRLIVEAVVVGLAVVAALLLVRRGPIAQAGLDPLLALTPLLLALAVSVLVLRLLPVVLRVAHTAARRSRGLIGFLGSARAVRDPALGVSAALAVVVGVCVAVFSSGVLATIDAGTQHAALSELGADVVATGAVFDAPARSAVARTSGVTHVAAIGPADATSLGVPNGQSDGITALLADTDALHAVRQAVPGGLGRRVDGEIPVVISHDLVQAHPIGSDGHLGVVDVRIVGEAPNDSRLGPDGSWVLADAAFAKELASTGFQPDRLLITTNSVTDATAAAAAVKKAQPAAVVRDAASVVTAAHAAPANGGLLTGTLAAAAAGALLAAIAVFAGSAAASASRNRTVAMLRTMGLAPRGALGLVAWELVPIVCAATAVGAALGLALPRLVTATTDLTPFTGGTGPVAVHTDWGRAGLIVLGFLAVTGVATLVAVLLARRADPARTVKMGAE